jgi:hypothetical protein
MRNRSRSNPKELLRSDRSGTSLACTEWQQASGLCERKQRKVILERAKNQNQDTENSFRSPVSTRLPSDIQDTSITHDIHVSALHIVWCATCTFDRGALLEEARAEIESNVKKEKDVDENIQARKKGAFHFHGKGHNERRGECNVPGSL